MERKSIQKYHTIFKIDEGEINQFFQVYDTFQYLLPLLEHQPAENVEWRMVFNNWLYLSTDEEALFICPTRSKVNNPTSVLFQELIKRPLMKQVKWEVRHNEQYTFIAAVTISMEVLNWYKQSTHVQKNEFQLLTAILSDYIHALDKGQEPVLIKMKEMLTEQLATNDDLSFELDYCLLDAVSKAKKLYSLFYDKKDFSTYKVMQYSKQC